MPHLRFLCLFSVAALTAAPVRAQTATPVPDWVMLFLQEPPLWVWGVFAGILVATLLIMRRRRRAAHRDRRRQDAERRAALQQARARRERSDTDAAAQSEDSAAAARRQGDAAAPLPARSPRAQTAQADDTLTLTRLANASEPEPGPRADQRTDQRSGTRPAERPAADPRPAPAAPSPPGSADAALLDFFAERFSLEDQSVDGVIAYMTKLAGAIERLKARADAAETRAEALDDALRRAGPANGAGADAAIAADPVAAGWRLAMDGARSIRIAAGALRRDPDFIAFSQLIGFEDAVRRLTAEQARTGGARIDPHLVEEDWPHALWRAEALLSAYFPTTGDWGDLRHGVSVAAAAIRQMLLTEGVAVGHVRMLAPYAAGDGEAWSSSADGLAGVAPIRARARRLAEAEAGANLVIDCEAFGFSDERRGLSAQARLITLDRDAWT